MDMIDGLIAWYAAMGLLAFATIVFVFRNKL
jgi:hypothetical protein